MREDGRVLGSSSHADLTQLLGNRISLENEQRPGLDVWLQAADSSSWFSVASLEKSGNNSSVVTNAKESERNRTDV